MKIVKVVFRLVGNSHAPVVSEVYSTSKIRALTNRETSCTALASDTANDHPDSTAVCVAYYPTQYERKYLFIKRSEYESNVIGLIRQHYPDSHLFGNRIDIKSAPRV